MCEIVSESSGKRRGKMMERKGKKEVSIFFFFKQKTAYEITV